MAKVEAARDQEEMDARVKRINELKAADEEQVTEESALRLALAELEYGLLVDEGLQILNQLANGGNITAVMKFAELFEHGVYYKKDEKKAFQCLKRADELGDAGAAYQLGRFYRLGIGVPVNEKAAIRCFFRAADRGYLEAEYQLAVACFAAGEAGEGADALRRCFEGGIEEAGYDYAMCLLYGDGVTADPARAARILENLARGGNKEAAEKLVFMYRNGFKVGKDREKAERLKALFLK